jgi:hypothetical protein
MTVHKIRLFYSVVGAEKFHQWLQQWHDSVRTETTDLITNETPDVPVSQLRSDATEYYSVTFSYPSDENPTEILEKPYQKLTEHCDWSKVGYHICDDVPDNPTKSDCHYPEDKIYRDGDMPDHIPSLN